MKQKFNRPSHVKEYLHYPRTLDTITPEDFQVSFNNNSMNGKIPLPWIELISSFDLTEMEIEELASRSEEWRRTIEIDKQKCQVTILTAIKDDPKLAWEYYKEEYGHEMSIAEKIEEAEGFRDVEDNKTEEDNSKE